MTWKLTWLFSVVSPFLFLFLLPTSSKAFLSS
ncbi:hypothetical protein ACFW04_005182 [Cataglyphis niger]